MNELKYIGNTADRGIQYDWHKIRKKMKELSIPGDFYNPVTAPIEQAQWFVEVSERASGASGFSVRIHFCCQFASSRLSNPPSGFTNSALSCFIQKVFPLGDTLLMVNACLSDHITWVANPPTFGTSGGMSSPYLLNFASLS